MLPKKRSRHVMRSPFLIKAIAFIKIFIVGKGFEPVRDFRRDQGDHLVTELVRAYFSREALGIETCQNPESLESELATRDRLIAELEAAWEQYRLETVSVTREKAIAIPQIKYSPESVGAN